MVIKLYLASLLLSLSWVQVDCCPGERRGSWLFGNYSALFTSLVICWCQRCCQTPPESSWIVSAITGLAGLGQAEQVQCSLGIWHLPPVLFHGVPAPISAREITLRWEPGYSLSLSPKKAYPQVLSALCFILLWICPWSIPCFSPQESLVKTDPLGFASRQKQCAAVLAGENNFLFFFFFLTLVFIIRKDLFFAVSSPSSEFTKDLFRFLSSFLNWAIFCSSKS